MSATALPHGRAPLLDRKRRAWIKAAVTYIVLSVGALLFLTPLFWQITTSLKTSADTMKYPPVWIPSPPQFQNYAELFERFPIALYTLNSVFVTTMVIIGTVLSSSLAAYGFARLRMPGRDVIFLILLSTLLLPGVVLIIPQFVLFQRLQWINTYNPLIVPSFFGSAFSIFLLRQFFLTIPRELEDAARIDGAGFLRIYAQIVMPLAWPAIIAVALYTFLGAWNNFLGPLIYLSDSEKYTLPVALRYLQGSMRTRPEQHLLMAAATLSMIPCVVTFFLAQRWFMQGQVFTGVKG
ncbi:MAG: carbohydrate ABC transporter permease [Anaerolineae bacterium]|nr:carbohydrate ABC transporter permease [Candidatus Roseilinea sp.]MDW8448398.1 carbohydrate ABC transporter permease [Anaerolineae bacterium]